MILPEFLEEDVSVYYAGVKKEQERLVGSGGRIYLVESYGKTIEEARAKVYDVLQSKNTSQTFFRKDIGLKGIRIF